MSSVPRSPIRKKNNGNPGVPEKRGGRAIILTRMLERVPPREKEKSDCMAFVVIPVARMNRSPFSKGKEIGGDAGRKARRPIRNATTKASAEKVNPLQK